MIYKKETNASMKIKNHCLLPSIFSNLGVYSFLEAELKFNRLYSYDILTVYVPWTMIIAISWSSFWIDPKGPSSVARFMIVTICLLYASYDAAKLNTEKLPKVSYTKMIDVWTGVRK